MNINLGPCFSAYDKIEATLDAWVGDSSGTRKDRLMRAKAVIDQWNLANLFKGYVPKGEPHEMSACPMNSNNPESIERECEMLGADAAGMEPSKTNARESSAVWAETTRQCALNNGYFKAKTHFVNTS